MSPLIRRAAALVAVVALAGCAAVRTNVLTRAQIEQLRLVSIAVDTSRLTLSDLSDQPRQAEIGPRVKAQLDTAFASRLDPAARSHLVVRLTRIDIPDGTAASLGLQSGPLEGLCELYLDDARTPTAVYPVVAHVRPSGVAGATVNGLPVGLLARAVVASATRPDGLEALAAAFAADTHKAVTTE